VAARRDPPQSLIVSRWLTSAAKERQMPVVTVQPGGEVIYLDPDETVLSGLYKAGYAYAVGCRRGGCAICKVDCLSGQFDYDHPIADTVLTVDERADGTCLTCRAVPKGDITIEMRNEDLRLINPFLRQINEKARVRAESVMSGTESKEQ
jgi:ferredoxin